MSLSSSAVSARPSPGLIEGLADPSLAVSAGVGAPDKPGYKNGQLARSSMPPTLLMLICWRASTMQAIPPRSS